MYCPYCAGEKFDWVILECPECGANEENEYMPVMETSCTN